MSDFIRDALIRTHKDGVAFGIKNKVLSAETYDDYISSRNASVEREITPLPSPTLIAKSVAGQISMLAKFIESSYGDRLLSYRSYREFNDLIKEIMTDMGIFDDYSPLASVVYSLLPSYDEVIAANNRALSTPIPTRKSVSLSENSAVGFVLVCSDNIAESMSDFAHCRYGDLKCVLEESHDSFKRHKFDLIDISVGLRSLYDKYYAKKYGTFDDFVFATINLPVAPTGLSPAETEAMKSGYIKIGRKDNVTKVVQYRARGGFYHDYCLVDDLENDVPLVIKLSKSGESKFADQLVCNSGVYYDGDIAVAYKKIMGSVYVSSALLRDAIVEAKSISHVDRLHGVMSRNRFSLKNCTVGMSPADTKKKLLSSEMWFGKYVDELPVRCSPNTRMSIVACVLHSEDKFNDNTEEVINECGLFDEADKSKLLGLLLPSGDKILNILHRIFKNDGSIEIKLKSGSSIMYSVTTKELVFVDAFGGVFDESGVKISDAVVSA